MRAARPVCARTTACRCGLPIERCPMRPALARRGPARPGRATGGTGYARRCRGPRRPVRGSCRACRASGGWRAHRTSARPGGGMASTVSSPRSCRAQVRRIGSSGRCPALPGANRPGGPPIRVPCRPWPRPAARRSRRARRASPRRRDTRRDADDLTERQAAGFFSVSAFKAVQAACAEGGRPPTLSTGRIRGRRRLNPLASDASSGFCGRTGGDCR